MNKVFAIATRGLESICANELAAVPGVTVEQIAYRRIFADCSESLTPLLKLRTVEDIFLQAATWQNIGRARSTLEMITAMAIRFPTTRWGNFAGCRTLLGHTRRAAVSWQPPRQSGEQQR